MRTGDDATEWGLYASDCCIEEKIFKKDDCFCRCPKCEGLCVWELVEAVVPLDEFRKVEHQAA